MTNIVVVLAILALALLAGWLILKDASRAFNNTFHADEHADVRCLWCGRDPKWCACRDELPTK